MAPGIFETPMTSLLPEKVKKGLMASQVPIQFFNMDSNIERDSYSMIERANSYMLEFHGQKTPVSDSNCREISDSSM